MLLDVIVVGGSYAGIAAALQIARARRHVLVIDAGVRRNRFARASHGFIGQDGRSPDAIAADARSQLMAYPTVTWIETTADRVGKDDDDRFVVEVSDGRTFLGRRMILATGVTDELPGIPGLAERWGRSVFHCPYCHGYELDRGSLGVLAVGPVSLHQAMLVPDWGSTTTFFINGKLNLDAAELDALYARGVTVEQELVAAVTGDRANVELCDGRTVELDALFTAPSTHITSPLAEQLGCGLEEGPLGQFIWTDATKQTTVPGVFACGDAARAAGSVSLAVGDGAMAGIAAHRSLIFDVAHAARA